MVEDEGSSTVPAAATRNVSSSRLSPRNMSNSVKNGLKTAKGIHDSMVKDKHTDDGRTTQAEKDARYLRKRVLSRTAKVSGMWGLGITSVVSGDFFGYVLICRNCKFLLCTYIYFLRRVKSVVVVVVVLI